MSHPVHVADTQPAATATTLDAPASRGRRADVPGGAAPSSSDLLRAGEVVGGIYEVRGKIGEGGMGQVFEAFDRTLGRRVAIKVALPGVAASSLEKEARGLAAIRHPGVVSVYGLGEHGGTKYVVMEHIPGRSLEAHLDAHAAEGKVLELGEIVEILRAMAEGLAVVHRAGMAHRDVKPANVMLAPGGRIVLTDFGIFRPESETRGGPPTIGSPHYMAPETAAMAVQRGEFFLVDVYALGIVAYQLLTGSVPYDAERVAGVLWKHLMAPVPDPSDRRGDVPPRLAALVREMLAKDPKSRPQSMEEIAWQLRRLDGDSLRPTQDACSVLVVEDNAATAAIVSSIVSEAAPEADVRVASDARTALELLRARAADLIVVDLHLPGESGVELCRQLGGTSVVGRSLVVATSAHVSREELATLRGLEFVRFLAKGDEMMSRLPALVGRIRRPASGG